MKEPCEKPETEPGGFVFEAGRKGESEDMAWEEAEAAYSRSLANLEHKALIMVVGEQIRAELAAIELDALAIAEHALSLASRRDRVAKLQDDVLELAKLL